MPYLTRHTVRSLLARSRPSPSPAPSRQEASPPTETPAAVEQLSPLPPSVSAPANLVNASASPQSSAHRAVTANENSPACAHSLPGSAANQQVPTPQDSPSDRTQPLLNPTPPPQQQQIADYLDAGIPIAEELVRSATTPPVFAPFVSAQVPASDSPPYEFNGLFAVPCNPPLTPGAPPLYQPHASEPEVFPQLPFTPFHSNAIAARSNNQIEYELPGDDRFPRHEGSRVVNGSWLGGRFERFTVGGRTFFCPVHLMLRYPHWRLLLNLERPPHGWVLSSTIDATIFALVMEALISPSGFDGTEPGLNLVKLTLAARQAHDWGMEREVAKLVASARRYVARRVFHRNPHRPDPSGAMDHHYFVHRSEDIFRSWRVLARAPRALQRSLPPAELVCLYALAVPRDLWPALTAEFPDEFASLIDYAARVRVVPEAVDFHDWWLRFFRRAGCLDFDWMADVPDVLGMLFRGEEEGAAAEQEQQMQAVEAADAH
ncbi:hypothetical protein PWT90_03963 [Aphanocladium album]|nr:hypothetical protein PWT90_03963 [Aphanocladium album]